MLGVQKLVEPPGRRSRREQVLKVGSPSDISASRCYDAYMGKVRTTLTVDEAVLRAVKVRGARTGKGDSEVIEDALRRELGLDLLERLWQRDDPGEDQALELAVEAQHKTRRRRR